MHLFYGMDGQYLSILSATLLTWLIFLAIFFPELEKRRQERQQLERDIELELEREAEDKLRSIIREECTKAILSTKSINKQRKGAVK